MDGPETITEEEFDDWEPFPVAHGRVTQAISYDNADAEIRRRIHNGSLRACAREFSERIVSHQGASTDVSHSSFAIIDSSAWPSGSPARQETIWKTSSFDFSVPSRDGITFIQCTGIRLEASGVDQILIDAGHLKPAHAKAAGTREEAVAQERQADMGADASRSKLDEAISGTPVNLSEPEIDPAALEPGSSIGKDLFETWTRVPVAYFELFNHYGDNDITISTIFRRVTNGLLRVAAELVVWQENDETRKDHFHLLTPQLWAVLNPGFGAHIWRNGEIDALILRRPGGYVSRNDPTVTLIDVRFEPSGIDRMLGRDEHRPLAVSDPPPVPPVLLAPPEPAKPKGGAPRKGWWDDLWIEVIRQVRSGKLTADSFSTAAKLEIHLVEIVEDQQRETRFSPGDSTVKPMSLKLFKYLKESGGK